MGPEATQTATGLNNLGTLLLREGRLEEALSYLGRSLNILEKVMGKWHPDTMRTRLSLTLVGEESQGSTVPETLNRPNETAHDTTAHPQTPLNRTLLRPGALEATSV